MSMHDDEICAGVPCTVLIGAAKKEPPPTPLAEVPATVIDVERNEKGEVVEILIRNEASDDVSVTTKNGEVVTPWYLPDEILFKAQYEQAECGACAVLPLDMMYGRQARGEWPPCPRCKGKRVIFGKRESFRAHVEMSQVPHKAPKPSKRAPLWFTFILEIGERRSCIMTDPMTLEHRAQHVLGDNIGKKNADGITTIMRERPHLPFFRPQRR